MSAAVPELRREQKVGLLLLLVFGVMVLSLGAVQIRNTIYAPFALNKRVPLSLKDEIDTPDALRWRDTDREGLTDWDEKFVYNTSVYLADTDSDTLSDAEEVRRGTDPLCPAGQDCSKAVLLGTDLPPTGTTTAEILAAQQAAELGQEPVNLEEALQDPAQIRLLLEGVGMSPEVLKQVTDQELLILVQQVISTSSTALEFASQFAPTSTR